MDKKRKKIFASGRKKISAEGFEKKISVDEIKGVYIPFLVV